MELFQRKKTSEETEFEKVKNIKPLYIIIFSNEAKFETMSWIIDLLTRSQHEGGAELSVHVTKTMNEGSIVEIGATNIRLLVGAEEMEIVKKDRYNNVREFVFSEIDKFILPGTDVHSLLSTSEKQRIILDQLMKLQAMEKKKLIGYSNIQLYPGQSVIQVCKNNGIIECMFPLHESSELKSLKNKWSWKCLPLSDIRNYFGEAVAFYFAFIFYYTWALLVPAVIGALQTIISFDISRSYIFFASIKMIWLTIFLEFWKRKSNELAYTWGTLKIVNIPQLHPTFRGRHMEIDPVTKKYVPVYPGYKRHFKVYCVTLPIVFVCLLFAVAVMLLYYKIEKLVITIYDDGSLWGWILTQVPGIVYAVIVYIMNVGYSYIACILTEWENHKHQESFENHRITKLLLLQFVNNFISMGYIAFYEGDLNFLKWQICIMMVINQLFNQLQGTMLPFLLKQYRKTFKGKNMSYPPRIQKILEQREMWSYQGTYDDYLELFIQFGYVFLFSAVFPLAAILAIVNNLIEVWADGFKLCNAYQRPQARPVKGIGIWQLAFEVISLLAVMSNCALIAMSPLVRSYAPDLSLSSWLLVAVVVEHIIIAVKMIMSYLISDTPKWVKVAIQKTQYESLEALKSERKEKNKVVMQSFNLHYNKLD